MKKAFTSRCSLSLSLSFVHSIKSFRTSSVMKSIFNLQIIVSTRVFFIILFYFIFFSLFWAVATGYCLLQLCLNSDVVCIHRMYVKYVMHIELLCTQDDWNCIHKIYISLNIWAMSIYKILCTNCAYIQIDA